jgi:F0F1-type ATP synthase assembly protein I
MAAPERDKRPPLAVAIELASQVISVALMMALPAGAGYWGDQKLGTSPWLVVVGAVVGLAAGMMQLLRGLAGNRQKTGEVERKTERKP